MNHFQWRIEAGIQWECSSVVAKMLSHPPTVPQCCALNLDVWDLLFSKDNDGQGDQESQKFLWDQMIMTPPELQDCLNQIRLEQRMLG